MKRYYKIWDGRNRLLFMTLEIGTAREFMENLIGKKLTYRQFNIPYKNARFFEGFKVEITEL